MDDGAGTATAPANEDSRKSLEERWDFWCKNNRPRLRKKIAELDFRLYHVLIDPHDSVTLEGLSPIHIKWTQERLKSLSYKYNVKVTITKPADWDLSQQLTSNLAREPMGFECEVCSRKLSNTKAFLHETGNMGPRCKGCIDDTEESPLYEWSAYDRYDRDQLGRMTLDEKWKAWKAETQYGHGSRGQLRMIETLFEHLKTGEIIVLEDNNRRWCKALVWVRPFLLKLHMDIKVHTTVVVDKTSGALKLAVTHPTLSHTQCLLPHRLSNVF
ncbi:hypothetical protein HK102_006254 [Quaeritorhiza haematococci]|nr:hypothetical protein HK102_006254 [Quaeritorhiza haematococci]